MLKKTMITTLLIVFLVSVVPLLAGSGAQKLKVRTISACKNAVLALANDPESVVFHKVSQWSEPVSMGVVKKWYKNRYGKKPTEIQIQVLEWDYADNSPHQETTVFIQYGAKNLYGAMSRHRLACKFREISFDTHYLHSVNTGIKTYYPHGLSLSDILFPAIEGVESFGELEDLTLDQRWLAGYATIKEFLE